MKEPNLFYRANVCHYSWNFPNETSHLTEYAIQYPNEFKNFQKTVLASAEALFYRMIDRESNIKESLDDTDFLKRYLNDVSSFLDDTFHKVIHQDSYGEYHFEVNMHLEYLYDTKDYEARFLIHIINWDRDVFINYTNWDPQFNKALFSDVSREVVRTLDKLTEESIESSIKKLLLGFCNSEYFVNQIKINPVITEKSVTIELEMDEITVDDVLKG